MKASISLKQLRTDPREFLNLINSGYEVAVTEHRRIVADMKSTRPATTNLGAIMEAIKALPPVRALDPELDTVEALKKAKDYHFANKYGRR